MLYIALLLVVPLAIRYLTSWHMSQLRLRLVLRADPSCIDAYTHMALSYLPQGAASEGVAPVCRLLDRQHSMGMRWSST